MRTRGDAPSIVAPRPLRERKRNHHGNRFLSHRASRLRGSLPQTSPARVSAPAVADNPRDVRFPPTHSRQLPRDPRTGARRSPPAFRDACPPPVTIDYFHQGESGPSSCRVRHPRTPCPACGPAKETLEDLVGVSPQAPPRPPTTSTPRPSLWRAGNVERVPALLLRRGGGAPPLRYYGLPQGHFFEVLVEVISAFPAPPPRPPPSPRCSTASPTPSPSSSSARCATPLPPRPSPAPGSSPSSPKRSRRPSSRRRPSPRSCSSSA